MSMQQMNTQAREEVITYSLSSIIYQFLSLHILRCVGWVTFFRHNRLDVLVSEYLTAEDRRALRSHRIRLCDILEVRTHRDCSFDPLG